MSYLGSNNRLFKFKVMEGNEILYDLYPVIRRIDNEVGLYDIINGVFYSKHSSCTEDFYYGVGILL